MNDRHLRKTHIRIKIQKNFERSSDFQVTFLSKIVHYYRNNDNEIIYKMIASYRTNNGIIMVEKSACPLCSSNYVLL